MGVSLLAQWSGLSARRLAGVAMLVAIVALGVLKLAPAIDQPMTGDPAPAAVARLLHAEGLASLPQQLRKTRERRASYAYILVVWTLAHTSSDPLASLACVMTPQAHCRSATAWWLKGVQMLAALGCLLLVYLILLEACGRREAALLGLALAAIVARFGAAALSLDGYMVFFSFFFLLYCLYGMRAAQRPSLRAALAAGASLGAAGLFHAPALLLALLLPVVLVVRSAPARRWARAAAALLATAGVTAPAIVLSLVTFGDPLPTIGHELRLLSLRVAFNAMTGEQYAAALVCWVPLFGKQLAQYVWGREVVDVLETLRPGTFAQAALERIEPAAWAAGGGPQSLAWMIRTHVLEDAPRYLVSTIPLVLRGIWRIGGVFALLALVLLPTGLRIARHRRESPMIAFVLLASLSLVVVHALIAPGYWWLNMPTLVVYPMVIAYVMQGF
ncbi:MAG: glycosyltransferase family 39 protein [Hyphomicrobiaceae bacterium]|nr:glycosyltransferase family 39 protein [Hyphomicrobiaceae bacterium]